MWSKALWYKNYKQSKFLCWAFLAVSFLIPLSVYSDEKNFERILEQGYSLPEVYSSEFFLSAGLFQILILFLLAATLIGGERNNYHYEFSLSLPVRRQDIFLSKWLLGAAVIFSGLTLGTGLALIQFYTSVHLKEYITGYYFLENALAMGLILMGIFSFVLMVGYLTGNIFAQVALSAITLVLPYGFIVLLDSFINYNFDSNLFISARFFAISDFSGIGLEEIISFLTLPLSLSVMGGYHHLGAITSGFSLPLWALLSPITYIIVTFAVTLRLSKYSNVEHHGKILLFKPLVPILRTGVFVCFFMLGGMIGAQSFGYVLDRPIIPYYIGAIIFGFTATFILNRMLNTKKLFSKKI